MKNSRPKVEVKLFLGWSNIKWLITELGNIYTSRKSYFSKKRIESSIAFVIGQIGMVWFLTENVSELSSSDIVLWAGVEFAISGYIVHQIQKEKTIEDTSETTSTDPSEE